ncbi:E3 ubiquitin-protein ligase lubel-like [Uloborus diversus]|uniref:E3 ubiquitin-protein ligase lubel-like n=1 Tax=Uloborus diversus TaxID=327109 RepID=UPI00240968EB|nr:E3 ubiquitin-protein ligase lubel-like [Uloborus diversus]
MQSTMPTNLETTASTSQPSSSNNPKSNIDETADANEEDVDLSDESETAIENLKSEISKNSSSFGSQGNSRSASRSNSITSPSPIDALRSKFEGLRDSNSRTTIGPIRPQSPFRRMSFNSRKEAIILEKKRENNSEKPWLQNKTTIETGKLTLQRRNIKQQLEMERRVRQMVSDRKCRTYRKAEIAIQLMDLNFEEDESLQAARECSTLEQAISYLQQECQLCTGHFPVQQIISMTHCPHKACRECVRAYFTVQIRDRTIMELLCPFCNEPDIGNEDIAMEYFNHLDIMLKKLVEPQIHELFQRKLRDRVLMRDPNFRWCSQCSSGFITEPNLKRLVCPDCNAVTCASCRRPWEREHQGISCEAFAAWKEATDPEAHAAGLARLLTEDGIDCPNCHFRYALAKGGCMHFRCIQCQHDFCSGCSRPFKMGQKCGVSEFCGKLGLHAHHPRNCLFYLRDKEPNDLQRLLEMNDVEYDQDPPEGVVKSGVCPVMEQKETADGMIDDQCGKEVEDGFAGLCRIHYVEYLGQLVNKHHVDPIQIFGNDDLELVLRRANVRLPPKRYRESEEEYRDKLIKVIQEELPLNRMDGS